MLGRETSVATDGRMADWRMHNFSGFELDTHCNSVYG